jgi:hypothetical protein
MTEEEQLVQLGEDAEAVLNSPAFERTVNKLVESTFQAFVNSKADEEDLRKQTYSHYRALVDVVNTLKQQVAVRDEILAKGDTSQEEGAPS